MTPIASGHRNISKMTCHWPAVGQHWKCIHSMKEIVGGWTNPFEKYARQNGNLPQIGVKIKNIWNHHPEYQYSASLFSTTSTEDWLFAGHHLWEWAASSGKTFDDCAAGHLERVRSRSPTALYLQPTETITVLGPSRWWGNWLKKSITQHHEFRVFLAAITWAMKWYGQVSSWWPAKPATMLNTAKEGWTPGTRMAGKWKIF